jgi:hypothetical protein
VLIGEFDNRGTGTRILRAGCLHIHDGALCTDGIRKEVMGTPPCEKGNNQHPHADQGKNVFDCFHVILWSNMS